MKTLQTGLLLMLVTSLSMGDEVEDVPVVMTLNGEISGLQEESTNGFPFFSYYSIPFAQPPVGDRRFKDPVKVDDWVGVRDGTQLPPVCPQYTYSTYPMNPELAGDEDCLYLNIFTARPNEEMLRLPVMVFIHGGGFFMGSSKNYPPHVMMNHDIVLVTIQYRLGMLGFLSTEDAEAPGNQGLRDQTMALTWIQNNIHMFGGNPLKITLFGESAGAASVHFQMLSPRSVGLFHRAILMSGSALAPYATGGAFKEVAKHTAAIFNCTTDGEGSKEIVSCLQGISADKLVPVQQQFNTWHLNPFLFAPRVDGDILPTDPETLMKEKRHKRLDLMSGITSHEGGLYSIPIYANEGYRAALMLNFLEIGPTSLEFTEGDFSPMNQTIKIYDRYLGGVNIDADNADNLTRMFSDRYFNIPHDLTSALHAKNVKKNRKKVFRYELTHRGQRSINDGYGLSIGKDYVSHADDLFYLFSGDMWAPLENEDDLKMREIMTTLWVNFATHGDPTPDDTLDFKWDPVTSDHMPHLNLKLPPVMEDDSRAETREFWASLPLRQNLLLHPERVANLKVTPIEETKEEAAPEGGVPEGESLEGGESKDEMVKDESEPQESTEEKESKEPEMENNKKDEL